MERDPKIDEQWRNIFDRDKLKDTVNIIALYITVYELLEDRIVTYPKDFYTIVEFDEEAKRNYKEHVLSLYDKKACPGINTKNEALIASLVWFITGGAIDENDINVFAESRNLRNTLVHEMMATITEGGEKLIKQFVLMYNLFRKIEKWWILEVEVPISGQFPNLSEEDKNGVMSGYMVVLDAIIDILANDSNKNYKEVCEKLGVPVK